VRAKSVPAAERLIKRYENRKLYEPAARRYVTVEDIGRSVGAGQDVRVVDSTGADITSVVLAQVILERVKERSGWIPQPVLVRLIRLAASPQSAWPDWPSPQDAAQRAREEAERIVAGLLSRGRLTLDEALALRSEITGSVQRIVTDAQQGVEARLRSLVDRADGEGVGHALSGLRDRLMSFESFLERDPGTKSDKRRR
jgi:polyhydroxyalkanoate synthesis repressor PhaR